MKYLLGAFLACAAIVITASVYLSFGRDAGRTPIEPTTLVRVFTDPDTGCHYLVHQNGGITPRLTGDGKILCIL